MQVDYIVHARVHAGYEEAGAITYAVTQNAKRDKTGSKDFQAAASRSNRIPGTRVCECCSPDRWNSIFEGLNWLIVGFSFFLLLT